MRALLLILLSAASMTASQNAASARSVARFSLLAPAKCDNALDARQCIVAGPKEWTADERRAMRDIVRRLSANELVRGILVGARENGYAGVRRYSTDTRQDTAFGRVPKLSPGFVLYGTKEVAVTDLFFQTADMRDPLSDYVFGDLILLHELIHAFDDRTVSADAGFASATGWTRKDDRWQYSKRLDYSAYQGVVAETMTSYARGRPRDAWARDRAFATSMPFPLPTIQSLASPGETFADVLAHLIVDSKASSYLKPEIVAWFEANVFPTLHEKAQRFRAADYQLF